MKGLETAQSRIRNLANQIRPEGREPRMAKKRRLQYLPSPHFFHPDSAVSERVGTLRLASCRALRSVGNCESNIFLISKSYIGGWLGRDTVHENACRLARPNGVAYHLILIDGHSPDCEKLVKSEISDGI